MKNSLMEIPLDMPIGEQMGKLLKVYELEDLESLLLNEQVALKDISVVGEDNQAVVKRMHAHVHLLAIHKVMLGRHRFNWLTREFNKEVVL